MSCNNLFFEPAKDSQFNAKDQTRKIEEKLRCSRALTVKEKITKFAKDHCDTFGCLSGLIVDDSIIYQKFHTRCLTELGFKQHFVAKDGQDAIEMLQKLSKLGIVINVILLDIDMPIMNGIEAATEIVKNKLAPNAAIIMISGNDNELGITTALTAGAVAYLIKPVDIIDLGNTIIKHVKLPILSSTSVTIAGGAASETEECSKQQVLEDFEKLSLGRR